MAPGTCIKGPGAFLTLIRIIMRKEILNVVAASDSFKGSLTSLEVAQSVEEAFHEVYPSCQVTKVNVADGGEGTMDALRQTLGGEIQPIPVHDPLGREIIANYVILDDKVTAVIEMSAASGLPLLKPEERNPLLTSTYGTGELILDALKKGCRKFLVGIGGSATNDAGIGMLNALGYSFLDKDGNELPPVGGSLDKIEHICQDNRNPALSVSEFIIACDVKAPLYGPEGAAYVFAPQKGADPEMAQKLDNGLRHFAEVSAEALGHDYSQMQGAGAAGGLGYAFRQFISGRLERGVEMVLDAIHFDEIISGADLVVTGEGKVDSQTLTGKTPFGVAQRAIKASIPVIAIGGKVEIDTAQARMAGFESVIQITPSDMPLSEAMKPEVAAENIRRAIINYCLNRHE